MGCSRPPSPLELLFSHLSYVTTTQKPVLQPHWEQSHEEVPTTPPQLPGSPASREPGTLPHLLGGAGDDALLETVGLLLEVLPGLVVPQQVVFYLEIKQTHLSRYAAPQLKSKHRHAHVPEPGPHKRMGQEAAAH